MKNTSDASNANSDLQRARDALADAAAAMKSGSEDIAQAAGECVKSHPFAMVAAAAAAGLLVGLLFARR